MMNIENPKDEVRRKAYKAAEVAADYQDAWQHWLLGHTIEKAFTVIAKGEQLLIAQNETGLNMQDPDKVRHRILTCKQYLEDNPDMSDKPSMGRVLTEKEAMRRAGKLAVEKLRKKYES